jgi:hypothetical protein
VQVHAVFSAFSEEFLDCIQCWYINICERQKDMLKVMNIMGCIMYHNVVLSKNCWICETDYLISLILVDVRYRVQVKYQQSMLACSWP